MIGMVIVKIVSHHISKPMKDNHCPYMKVG